MHSYAYQVISGSFWNIITQKTTNTFAFHLHSHCHQVALSQLITSTLSLDLLWTTQNFTTMYFNCLTCFRILQRSLPAISTILYQGPRIWNWTCAVHLVEVGRVFVSSTKYAVLNALITYLSWKPTNRYNQKWGRTKRTRIRAKG